MTQIKKFNLDDRVSVVEAETVYANINFHGKIGVITEVLETYLCRVYRVEFPENIHTGLYIGNELELF